jgi:hypothetical protein
MAGAMIPLEVLNRKSLFSLLYKIDLDLAEQARAGNCPIAGVLCIARTTLESLAVGPRILKRLSKFALACAAVGRVAAAFGAFLGPPCLLGAGVAARHRPAPGKKPNRYLATAQGVLRGVAINGKPVAKLLYKSFCQKQ